ncbi:ADP-ribose glycohydrolase OARD1 isoform X1 [Phasianus colchicus]|uniref:ADP-ribose glycohydrolase OARD1 isoform X1 n=2 Tax=Phasianus colchicus TaxID=9054 RepID=UPI00129DEA4A|nr:ADP-ribose glycohydrolase OARD1 isoform X1 [Phasianus colchicus]
MLPFVVFSPAAGLCPLEACWVKAQPRALSHAAPFPSEVPINAVLVSVVFPATEAFTVARLTMATHSPEQGERIKCVKGDLFSCPPTDALAHCISEDCRMGAGIAVLFKKKFGGVQELLDQQKKTGEVAVLQRDDRYIYYLITKKKVSHKPTYEDMRKSLEAMKTHCLNNGVTDISMPKIGCGLDRLDWDKVSAILGEVFEDTDIKITVYTL